MVLPQTVNKATGLRKLPRTLRRSEHNTIGMGDAENDHALLETCEIGVSNSNSMLAYPPRWLSVGR
jgi:hydroxymethylpyrimidine pyrophosphatase-like HAD family hydrolase